MMRARTKLHVPTTQPSPSAWLGHAWQALLLCSTPLVPGYQPPEHWLTTQ
jgi:hypothetical protein